MQGHQLIARYQPVICQNSLGDVSFLGSQYLAGLKRDTAVSIDIIDRPRGDDGRSQMGYSGEPHI